jgi:hypothetical protein
MRGNDWKSVESFAPREEELLISFSRKKMQERKCDTFTASEAQVNPAFVRLGGF